VWGADEYVKLKGYDEQPYVRGEEEKPPVLATFHCHQQHATGVDTVCRGWLSVHRDSVAVRFAVANELLTWEDVPEEAEPLYYETGTEACEAGLAGVPDPSDDARQAIDRLVARGVGKWEDEDDDE